jgi:hypothetical protein
MADYVLVTVQTSRELRDAMNALAQDHQVSVGSILRRAMRRSTGVELDKPDRSV